VYHRKLGYQEMVPVDPVTGRFAPSSVRPWTFRPQERFAPWTQSTFPSHFLYILFFVIVKLHLTTFVKANNDEDPAYSVKNPSTMGETSWGRAKDNIKGPRIT